METRTYKVYKFDKLPDDVKENAIDRYRDINVDHDWWDYLFDDFKAIAKILGIEIDQIYFSGFASQGDGLCFTGSFEYAKGWRKALDEYAPKRWKDTKTGEVTENRHNAELHEIGERLQALQKTAFYGVCGIVEHRGHYQHSGCTDFDVRHNWDGDVEVQFDPDDFKQVYRELMDTFYYMLRREYDYLTSDECITESLIANEYDFNENGEID